MATDYAKALGARLRAIRQQQGLSLHRVEERSDGVWKAVVVGSYERGDRAISVQKLAALAEFYGVSVTDLLPDASDRSMAPPVRLVIDLDALALVPTAQAGPLMRYAASIKAQRGEPMEGKLPVRQDDLRTLAVIYDRSPATLVDAMVSWGVLDEEARGIFDV